MTLVQLGLAMWVNDVLVNDYYNEEIAIIGMSDSDIQTAAETMRLKAIKFLTEARLAAQQQ